MRLQMKQAKKRDRFRKLDSLTIGSVREEEPNLEDNERLIHLRNCIKTLNDADKAVITLCLEELSYKEISDITGLSENHVAVKIKRIKIKLLNCLKEKI